MKQNRQVVLAALLAVIIAVGGPFYIARGQAKALDAKTSITEDQTKELKTKVDQAKLVKKNRENYTTALDKVRGAMPADNDIQGAIKSLQDLAIASNVEWISFGISSVVTTDAKAAPAPAKAAENEDEKTTTTTVAKGTATTVAPSVYPVGGFDVAVELRGTHADVLAYLDKIRTAQSPARLFVVTTVAMDFRELDKAPSAGSDGKTTTKVTLRAPSFGARSAKDGVTNGASPVAAGETPVAPAVPTTTPTPNSPPVTQPAEQPDQAPAEPSAPASTTTPTTTATVSSTSTGT
jgi:hypothetical protein